MIRVTVTDTETGETDEAEFLDSFVVVTAGSAYVSSRQIHRNKDGTITTVLTVKGARP